MAEQNGEDGMMYDVMLTKFRYSDKKKKDRTEIANYDWKENKINELPGMSLGKIPATTVYKVAVVEVSAMSRNVLL